MRPCFEDEISQSHEFSVITEQGFARESAVSHSGKIGDVVFMRHSIDVRLKNCAVNPHIYKISQKIGSEALPQDSKLHTIYSAIIVQCVSILHHSLQCRGIIIRKVYDTIIGFLHLR